MVAPSNHTTTKIYKNISTITKYVLLADTSGGGIFARSVLNGLNEENPPHTQFSSKRFRKITKMSKYETNEGWLKIVTQY